MEKEISNRNYQDTVFRKLFSTKEKLIELFNALEGTDYGPDTPVEITTLEDALFVSRKNDLGFVIDQRFIILTEHQSTINPNMPLRQLCYVGRTFEQLTAKMNLYGTKLQTLPMPEFYVIYTGDEPWETNLLRLSQSFSCPPAENSMELVVKVIDLSYNTDKEILQRSETLAGYSKLLSYIKTKYRQDVTLTEAIDYAIKRCLEENCLTDFLKKYGSEVQSMLFEEITMEEFAELRAEAAAEQALEEGIAQGLARGREEGISLGLKEGIAMFIQDNLEESVSSERIIEKLMRRFSLSEEQAEAYLQEEIEKHANQKPEGKG